MAATTRIVECVPNFSEGRDLGKIANIVSPFRGRDGVKLLDYQRDEDHNRCVVTVVGEPEALAAAVLEAMGAPCWRRWGLPSRRSTCARTRASTRAWVRSTWCPSSRSRTSR